MTYAAMSPPLTLIAVAAPLIIPILFGDGWSQSASVAQILALAGLLVVGATLDHGLFYGTGKPGQWFVYAVIIDALTLSVTALTARWGLEAIAFGFLAVAVVATATRWFLVARLLETSPRSLAAPFGFLAAAVLIGGGAGWVVLQLSAGLHPVVSIVLVGLAVLAADVLAVRLFARDVIRELAGYLPRLRLATRFSFSPKTKEQS